MSIEPLLEVMQRLRDPDTGCAWDQEQTFKSIAAYTLEEAYEVVDAIERGDLDDLKDELGDLLLQVVFHSQIASEQDAFTFDDVVSAIVDKMIRRHPHVFGDVQFNNTAEMKASWEAEKARERAAKNQQKNASLNDLDTGDSVGVSALGNSGYSSPSALDGIAKALPSLKRADKIQKRAARVGFDWPDAQPIYAKIVEEADEVKEAVSRNNRVDIEDELGDLLFSVVNLARFYEIDSELALMRANEKFSTRFKGVEKLALSEGADMTSMTLAELDGLWDRVKKQSRRP